MKKKGRSFFFIFFTMTIPKKDKKAAMRFVIPQKAVILSPFSKITISKCDVAIALREINDK